MLSRLLSQEGALEEFLGGTLLNINEPSKNFTSLTAGVFAQEGVCLYFFDMMPVDGSSILSEDSEQHYLGHNLSLFSIFIYEKY